MTAFAPPAVPAPDDVKGGEDACWKGNNADVEIMHTPGTVIKGFRVAFVVDKRQLVVLLSSVLLASTLVFNSLLRPTGATSQCNCFKHGLGGEFILWGLLSARMGLRSVGF